MALALRRASGRFASAWNCGNYRRFFASVGDGKEVNTLPLSGIRVLDMTRVLAGVSGLCRSDSEPKLSISSRTAHRFLETLGMIEIPSMGPLRGSETSNITELTSLKCRNNKS